MGCAEALYEPDWRSGKAIPAWIRRQDGKPMGIAGLWETWKSPEGRTVFSFTMLTINADSHPLMRPFHKPDDEKRMVVVLDEAVYDAWHAASAGESREFLRHIRTLWTLAILCNAKWIDSLIGKITSMC